MIRNAFQMEIASAIDRSDRTQTEIAHKLGYVNPNIITMFKKGTTRVPLAKVAGLSLLLGLDPSGMLRQWFSAYEPEAMSDMNTYFRLS